MKQSRTYATIDELFAVHGVRKVSIRGIGSGRTELAHGEAVGAKVAEEVAVFFKDAVKKAGGRHRRQAK